MSHFVFTRHQPFFYFYFLFFYRSNRLFSVNRKCAAARDRTRHPGPHTRVLVEDGIVSAEEAATMLQSPAVVAGTPRSSIPSTPPGKSPSSSTRALVGVGVGVGGGTGVSADLVGGGAN